MSTYGINLNVNPGVNSFIPTSGFPVNTWNASPASMPPPPVPTQRPQPARAGHQKKASEDIDVLGLMMEAEERRRASMEDQGRPAAAWTEISTANATQAVDKAEWPSMGETLVREDSKSSLSSWIDVQEGKSESSA